MAVVVVIIFCLNICVVVLFSDLTCREQQEEPYTSYGHPSLQ